MWVLFAAVIIVFCILAFVIGQIVSESKRRSGAYGPSAFLHDAPVVAKGTLTYSSPNYVFQAGQAYILVFHKQRSNITGQYESKLGVGALRTRGRIYLTCDNGRIEGRYPNGSATNTVKGTFTDTSATVSAGLDVGILKDKLRGNLTLRIENGAIALDSSQYFLHQVDLNVNSRQLKGHIADREGNVTIDMTFREVEPSIMVLATVLLAKNILFIHSD
jgi:hypothetical protein